MSCPAGIAIYSIARPTEQYAKRTVESMLSKDSTVDPDAIRLCAGSLENHHLVDVPGKLVPMPEDQWQAMLPLAGAYRLTLNAKRAFEAACEAAETIGAKWAVVAEDDIELSRNWLTRAVSLASAARGAHEHFGITLCTSHPMWCFPKPGFRCGKDAIHKFTNPALFWGAQILVYPLPTAKWMIAHLLRCSKLWQKGGSKTLQGCDFPYIGDQSIKLFFQENGQYPLFASVPSLAKHTGATNTWALVGSTSSAFKDHPTARFDDA